MIRAVVIDGHWRVVDGFDRRYMPNAVNEDGAIGGSFITPNGSSSLGWDESTRFDERTALLLAGVLRKLHDMEQERAMRIVLTCDNCNKYIRNRT